MTDSDGPAETASGGGPGPDPRAEVRPNPPAGASVSGPGTSVLAPPPPPTTGDAQGLPPFPSARPARGPRPADPAPGRLLILAVVGGLAFDLGLRGGLGNAFVTGGVALVAVALATDGRLRNRQARVLALLAVLPAGFLVLRSSPWLVTANVGAAALLLGASVAWSSGGSVADARLGDLLIRWGRGVPLAWSAPTILHPLLPRVSGERADQGRAVLKALALALPVLTLVVGLLASADAVFAALLTPDVEFGPTISHLLLVTVAALAIVMFVGAAAATGTDAPRKGTFGSTEVVTMLGLAVAVLGVFSVAQVLALTGAGEQVVTSSGLTPAEYARTGFFQLCWATGILVVFLAGVRALAAPGVFADRRVKALAALAPLLTLGLVVVSLRRMALYDAAFGLTMLRVAVVAVTLWLGVTLVLMAIRNLGLLSGREWLLGASAATALVLLAVANVANPEALVVRHNLDRASQGEEIDTSYFASLSDDAVPAIADAQQDTMDPALADDLERALRCGDDRTGASAWNVAARSAATARADACKPQP